MSSSAQLGSTAADVFERSLGLALENARRAGALRRAEEAAARIEDERRRCSAAREIVGHWSAGRFDGDEAMRLIQALLGEARCPG